jgi:hypothetical protein
VTTFRSIERAGEELGQFHRELLQLEKRVNSVMHQGIEERMSGYATQLIGDLADKKAADRDFGVLLGIRKAP